MADPPQPVRLRVVFDDRGLLRRGQREDGLRRCWLLLRPELTTVADLAAHLARRFCLRRSCPHGVLLSMDGFVLPPLESTCIFRDKDIIRVKQKVCKKIVGHTDVHSVQDPEIVEERLFPINEETLATEYPRSANKHQEENEQVDHQHEENATLTHNPENEDASSKRKWQDADAEKPGKKKSKVTNLGKHISCSKEDEGVHQHWDQYCSKKLICSRNCTKSLSIETETMKASIQGEASVTLEEEQKVEGNNQIELNCHTKVVNPNAESDTKKLPSRSARRKKLKRKFRQKTKQQLKESQESPNAADCPSSSSPDGLCCPLSSNPNNLRLLLSTHQAAEEESDTSDEIVPVVVRPGHIRFEPAGGESTKSQAKETQATIQWNGTISKMGQQWGMDNSNKKNADGNYEGRMAGRNSEINHLVVHSKTNENGFCGINNQNVGDSSHDESASEKFVAEQGKSSTEHLDFESLYPLTRLPKEGDLIVYRLVELSSSWCPELSPYRVGEVLIYDPISMRIILLPVPDYPIFNNKCENESDMQLGMSSYKEDGSLEIEYSSLLDVRLLKGNESVPVMASTPHRETGKKSEPRTSKQVALGKNKGKIHSHKAPLVPNNTKYAAAPRENTQSKVWEETGQVSNDKSEPQENGWEAWTPNTSTSSWSYRALRGSALGPTLAFLRGKNNQAGKSSNRKFSK